MNQITKNQLTIALITYNRAHYLKHTIEAILKQTYKEYDLCIYDNGSNDNTREIVASFNDSRIRYVHYEINSREVANQAIILCHSDYLIISHDDDIMKPDMLRRQMNILKSDKKVIMVSTNMDYINESNNIIQKHVFPIYKDTIYEKYEYIKNYCVGKNYISCPTVMFRMEFIRKNMLCFKEDIGPAADTYLWFEINSHDKKIYIIKDSLYLYRIHNNQDSSMNYYSMHMSFYKHACLFMTNNKLSWLLPELRHLLVKNIISKLFYDYSHDVIGRNECISKISQMKEVRLWECDMPAILKLKLFMITAPSSVPITLFAIIRMSKSFSNKLIYFIRILKGR